MTDLKPGDLVECVDVPDLDYGNDWTPNGSYRYVVTRAYESYDIDYVDVRNARYRNGRTSNGWQADRFRKVDPEPAPPLDRGYAAGLADAVAWLRRDGRPGSAAGLEAAVDAGTVTAPPVPALPAEPYTVIRCFYSAGHESTRLLLPDGSWQGQSVEYVRAGLTGFEVVARPVTP